MVAPLQDGRAAAANGAGRRSRLRFAALTGKTQRKIGTLNTGGVGRRIAPLYASVGRRWQTLLSNDDRKTLALLLDLFTQSEAVTHEEALRTRASRRTKETSA